MRKLTIATLVALLLVAMAVNVFAQAPRRLPREETLYEMGQQWGPPTNFNPFNTTAAWPILQDLKIYETLFGYNLITGQLEPILGKSYTWVDDLTLRIELQPDTRWQDGTPLTAEDVVYTFKLGKKYALSHSPLWNHLLDAIAVDDRTIELRLNPENPHKAMVETYIGTIRIVPKHIWIEIEKTDGSVTKATNLNPVGSGPYKLIHYDTQQIILERDDNYWGIPIYGKPAPRYIVHPIFKSNDAGNLAFERGQVDLSQQFTPEIWKMWEEKKLPVGTWYKDEPYFVPASIPILFINNQKYPLSLREVRRAIAFAIDYAKIAETAMSRYSEPVKSSLLVPGVPKEAKYFNEENVKKYGWEYNPEKAIEILEKELGAKKGADGIYVLPDGTRLGPFYAECPYGWTDWMTALEVVAQSCRAIGIDVQTKFPDTPVWTEHRDSGNFDLLLNTPAADQSPAQPWVRIRDVMDSRDVPDVGQGTAYRNWGRYRNEKVHELLDKAALTTDEAELTKIYQELDIIFMQDAPAIPLMYRPWEFFSYNETYWTGFPNEDNPVAPPQFDFAGIRVLFNLKPAKK